MSFKQKIKVFFNKVGDLVFPEDTSCIFCGREIPSPCICDKCKENGSFNNSTTCIICDTPIKEGNIICDFCKSKPKSFNKCLCPFIYDGDVRKSILKFKSDGAKYLAKYYAKFMYDKLKENKVEFDVIVPVPSHSKTIKMRGYNPAKVLSDEISKLCSIPVVEALYKTAQTTNQKYLNFEERQNNLENSTTLLDKSAIKNKKAQPVCGGTDRQLSGRKRGPDQLSGCYLLRDRYR